MTPFIIIAVLFTAFLVWFFIDIHRTSVRMATRRKVREAAEKEQEDSYNARQKELSDADNARLKEAKAKVEAAESELRVCKMVTKHFEDEEADIRRQLAELDAKGL